MIFIALYFIIGFLCAFGYRVYEHRRGNAEKELHPGHVLIVAMWPLAIVSFIAYNFLKWVDIAARRIACFG